MSGLIGAAVRGFVFGYLALPGLYLLFCVCTHGSSSAEWTLTFATWQKTFFHLQKLFCQVGGVCAVLNALFTLFPVRRREYDYDDEPQDAWFDHLLSWVFFWLRNRK